MHMPCRIRGPSRTSDVRADARAELHAQIQLGCMDLSGVIENQQRPRTGRRLTGLRVGWSQSHFETAVRFWNTTRMSAENGGNLATAGLRRPEAQALEVQLSANTGYVRP